LLRVPGRSRYARGFGFGVLRFEFGESAIRNPQSAMSSAAANAVFLSYASQDAEAARKICEALRAAQVEVWFDQSELVGGDAWDAKIRGQIASCALFVPIISAATQARLEGYFRIEWKLAARRTHAMATAKAFLLPVVIDATRDAEAHVPDEFRDVQWTRLPSDHARTQFGERLRTLLSSANASPMTLEATRSSGDGRLGQTTRTLNRFRFIAAAVALAGVAVALAISQSWKTARSSGAPTVTAAKSGTAHPESIVVLPFANISADKEDTEYFSDGITEEILNALDRNPALRVTPRTSAFSFKGRNVPLDEIGRTLRVASVIEGSVRKAGPRVKITVKLLNAADGSRIWGEEFDRDMTPAEIFGIQSEIALKVAQKLSGVQVAATGAKVVPEGTHTSNLAAYDAYLRGRAAQLAFSVSTQAIAHFDTATSLDPNYALAWARLAQSLVRLQQTTVGRTETNISRAREAAARAVTLSPNLPEAHLALAAVERDQDAVRRELDRVERLRPGDAELLAARASLEYVSGNWGPDFARLVKRAVERDPQNAGIKNVLGRALSNAGHFHDAAQLLSAPGTATRDDGVRLRSAWIIIQNTLRWTGDVAAGMSVLETTTPGQTRDALFFAIRAGLHMQEGNLAAALADCESVGAASKLPTGGMAHRHPQTYSVALIEAKLGRSERAAELWALTLANAQNKDEADPLRFYAAVPALVMARRGQHAEARAALESDAHGTESSSALMRAFSLQSKAETLAVLGETDEAVATLRRVHEMGYGFGYTLRLDLEWESLRNHAQFQQLMKEAEARADAQPRPKP
jgi:TolB-like protein